LPAGFRRSSFNTPRYFLEHDNYHVVYDPTEIGTTHKNKYIQFFLDAKWKFVMGHHTHRWSNYGEFYSVSICLFQGEDGRRAILKMGRSPSGGNYYILANRHHRIGSRGYTLNADELSAKPFTIGIPIIEVINTPDLIRILSVVPLWDNEHVEVKFPGSIASITARFPAYNGRGEVKKQTLVNKLERCSMKVLEIERKWSVGCPSGK
jgi:hypothetical protein